MRKVSSGVTPLIGLDPNGPIPLYRQVYEAYRSAIVSGKMRPGERVPSTRTLAPELGISRFPLLNAYAQLAQEGYFESRVGSGTIVSRSLPENIVSPSGILKKSTSPRGPRPLSRCSSALLSLDSASWHRGWGAFVVSQVAHEHFPFRTWNGLVARHLRTFSAKSFDYGDPMGSPHLRRAIATYLRTARGVNCEAEQIIVVSGSQQGLEITTRVLLDPDDSVWMEEPGYRLARSVFASHDCRTIPVSVDSEGLDVAAGVRRCANARAALVTPSHQYPLGVLMTAARRLQLLEWAQKSGAWIIEDDYDSEYRYESAPIPSLQGLDRNARVVYIGTFSKVLFPSLRLGYLAVPADLVKHFLAVRLAMDIGPPGLYQAVLADFILEDHFSRHIRRMRAVYSERRTSLVASLQKEFGSRAEITGTGAGMHLAVTFKGIRDRELAAHAAREKLWLTPLSTSYLGRPLRQGFILGFGSTPAEQIPGAVRKLGALLGSA